VRAYVVSVEEEEANFFAALLLMPSPHFERAMDEVNDFNDDEALRRVAKLFQVSVGAVMFRELVVRPKLKGKEARPCHN
jgi:Zn-dependent peptidase ImmA (M78 family)